MFSKYSSVCRNCSVNRHYSGTRNCFALVHYLSAHSSMTLMHLPQLGIKFKNSVAVEGGPLHSHLFMNDRFFFLIIVELVTSEVLLEWPRRWAVAGCDASAWRCSTTQAGAVVSARKFWINRCTRAVEGVLVRSQILWCWGRGNGCSGILAFARPLISAMMEM